jgi:hypothetical protein
VGLAQNKAVKKISSWAAILFAPTLVAAIYGMNFHNMPELHWAAGYPLSIALMVASNDAAGCSRPSARMGTNARSASARRVQTPPLEFAARGRGAFS